METSGGNVGNPKKNFRLIIQLWLVFEVSVLVFLTDFVYVIAIKKVLFNEAPDVFGIVLLASMLVGGLSFFLAIVLSLLRKHFSDKKITFSKVLLILLTLPVLPFYLFVSHLLDKNRKLFPRLLSGSVLLVVLFPFWILGYVVLYYVSTDELFLGSRYQVSSIAYSDSMMPTFKPGSIGKYYPYKNIFYKLNPNWAYKIERGDIVRFSSGVTQDYLNKEGNIDYHNFVKRVIAIEGDKVELRAGVVILNSEPLSEPYTLEPNSTFALDDAYKNAKSQGLSGLFLDECKAIVIPEGKLFVLGDNRKNSNDSRVIGLVDLADINGYFPYKEQKQPFKEGVNVINYSDQWRTSTDLNSSILQKVENYCL